MATTKSHTICWDCANACGNCSWSSVQPVPVSGWVAKPIFKQKSSGSFIVYECPLFIRDAVDGGMKWTEKKNTIITRKKK